MSAIKFVCVLPAARKTFISFQIIIRSSLVRVIKLFSSRLYKQMSGPSETEIELIPKLRAALTKSLVAGQVW
jgi:hypothetical protein